MALKSLLVGLLASLALSGCIEERFEPTVYEKDICRVVHANYGWAHTLARAEKDHGITPGTILSVIYHESSFKPYARPPREKVLGFIPLRTRSEYGYGQVKDQTWRWYLDKNRRMFRSRTSFADTVEFIAWYYDLYLQNAREHTDDAYDFYLAYREGLGGYSRLTEISPWLDKKASSVQRLADSYDLALRDCT